MNTRLLVSLFLIVSILKLSAQDIFSDTDRFLKNYVVEGKVDYKRIKLDASQLDSLYNQFENYSLIGTSLTERKAFYINAYNIYVIKGVLDHYPVAGPMEIDGFFKEKLFTIAGEELTLDQIEFERLFAAYDDPRMHFALNCGAMSCPTLYSEAFKPEQLEEQLQFCQLMVIDREDYVMVDQENEQIKVCKIFEWYQDMFEAEAGSLRNYINETRFVSVPNNYPIVFMEYDWSLNELLN